MKKYYFNTGVKISANSNILGGIDSDNGIIVIPFECENVPEGATFAFACNNPAVEYSKNMIVREIHNSKLASKYAYFFNNL